MSIALTASRPLSAFATILVLAAGATPVRGADGPPQNDALRALEDEMRRSLEHLKMENVERPFLVEYVLLESERFDCGASLGALAGSGRSHSRYALVDVRVGDYVLDNSNFGRGGSASSTLVPMDDAYLPIRQQLWLATDGRYKAAVEELASKKSWLQNNSVPDRPDDLSRVEPIQYAEEYAPLDVDEEALRELTKELSALFRDVPEIQNSGVSLRTTTESRTLLNTEGTRARTTERWVRVSVNAGTQAQDGMLVGDLRVFYGRDAADLRQREAMADSVRDMIQDLVAKASGPRAEEYVGPVLFEGDAACQLMVELLVARLSDPHEPLGSRDGGTPYKNRLKKRIAPPFLTVVDDPTRREYEGVPLLGAFTVDHDGVRTRPITLVEEGRLKEWYMSRIPTRAIRETNGHSRDGTGGPGCVFVTSANAKPDAELRAELMRIAAEQELPYAIRVESLARADVPTWGVRSSGWYGDGNIDVSPPIAAYRVYPDGREEPVRGAEWQGVTLRTLRDVFLTGDRAHVMNTTYSGNFVSVVCPSLLVEELEMKKPAPQESKLPYLPHPAKS